MKLSSKVTSLILSAALCLSFAPSVSAKADKTVYSAGNFSKSDIQLMEKIKSMIQNFETTPLDISDYHVDYDEFQELYGTVVLNEPSLFYVSTVSAQLSYNSKKEVISFAPIYRFTKSRAKTMQKEINAEVNKLMSGVDKNWSDTEKVLYTHEYLSNSITYYNGINSYKGRNIYEAFVDNSAVCVGYALSFQYIMDLMDIPCICITSDTHIWNMVELDSNWYHVDVTWDDSYELTDNFFMHDMLLMSEYAIDNNPTPHEEWDYGMEADSSKYDNYFWLDTVYPIVYADDWWYYTTVDGLKKYSFEKNTSKLVSKLPKWKSTDGTEWLVSFSNPVLYNNNIYFNSPSNIYRYSLDTKKVYNVSEPSLQKGYQIFNFNINEQGVMTIYSSNDFDDMQKNSCQISLNKTSTSTKSTVSKEQNKKSDGITASDNGNTITISWNEQPNAEQYMVYRYNKSTKKIVKIKTTIDTSFTYKKTDKDANCLYAIKVRTEDGTSDYSGWVSAQ